MQDTYLKLLFPFQVNVEQWAAFQKWHELPSEASCKEKKVPKPSLK